MMEKAVFINGVLALSNSPIANEEIEEIYWGMWRNTTVHEKPLTFQKVTN